MSSLIKLTQKEQFGELQAGQLIILHAGCLCSYSSAIGKSAMLVTNEPCVIVAVSGNSFLCQTVASVLKNKPEFYTVGGCRNTDYVSILNLNIAKEAYENMTK